MDTNLDMHTVTKRMTVEEDTSLLMQLVRWIGKRMPGICTGKRAFSLLLPSAVLVIVLISYYNQPISYTRTLGRFRIPIPRRNENITRDRVGIFAYAEITNLDTLDSIVKPLSEGLRSHCVSDMTKYHISLYLIYHELETNKLFATENVAKTCHAIETNLFRVCHQKRQHSPTVEFQCLRTSRSATLAHLAIGEAVQEKFKKGIEYICVKSINASYSYSNLNAGIEKLKQSPGNIGVVFLGNFDNLCVHASHMKLFPLLYPRADDTNSPADIGGVSFNYVFPKDLIYHIGKTSNLADKNMEKDLTTLMANHKNEVEKYVLSLAGEVPTNTTVPRLGLSLPEKKVISMSLYGSDPRYTANALRNLKMAKDNFPGWVLRIYIEKTENNAKSKYPMVPVDIIKQLEIGGAELKYVNLLTVNIPPMMWRFLVADDPEVDVFIVRDCDSHLIKRDAEVVLKWLETNSSFHCIRDHPSHGLYSLSGGLWGARREGFRRALGGVTLTSLMTGYTQAYLQDMNFLGSIWPKVKDVAYCHDSVSCDKWPSSHPFPVKRNGEEHIGAVYDGNGEGRPGDNSILKNTPMNQKCVPANKHTTR